MIEVLPNWHPIFVHFSIALLVVATVAFFASIMASQYATRYQIRQYARWTLWLGVGISVLTVAAGMYAYFTVDHDSTSHRWMTIHRNVALGTFALFMLLAVWSAICTKRQVDENKGFLALLLVGVLALLSTSWLGGELVYRYGLGVKSLPDVSSEGHNHQNGAAHSHTSVNDGGRENLMDDVGMTVGEPGKHEHKDDAAHSH